MKNLKLLVFAIMTILFVGMGNVSAQENSSKMVIIRVIEGHGSKTGLVTIDPDGKKSTISLEKGHDLDISANNGVLIQKELEKWKQAGYKITHVSTSGTEVFRTTIILEK